MLMTALNLQKISHLTGHNASIYALSPFEAPHLFLSGGGEGWIVKWDLHNPDLGQLVAKVETQVFALHYSQAHQLIIAGNMNGGLHFIPREDPEKNTNIAHHQRGVFGIMTINDKVWTIGGMGMVTQWTVDPIRSEQSYKLSHTSLRSIAFSPQRNEVAIGASDGCIYLLDAGTMAIKHTITAAHQNSVFCVQYHPNLPLLVSGSRDAHLRAWNFEKAFQLEHSIPAHMYTINALAFSPDGRWLATGSRDKTLKIWDAQSFELLKVVETIRDQGHLNSVNTLYWAFNQHTLVSGSDDRSMIIWAINE